MRVDLFDFDLPDERIATEPVSPREAARMLVVPPDGPFADALVGDLPDLLRAGDLFVFNDTKVLPAQLEGVRERVPARGAGGEVLRTPIGLTLHRRTGPTEWLAFARGARKIRAGDRLVFERGAMRLEADAGGRAADGSVSVRFDVLPDAMAAALEAVGSMPLPSYITARRAVSDADRENYQTMFARREGAVAAPTAGLHMTPTLLDAITRRGVGTAAVTLHVGAGTFLPVKVDDTDDHPMHVEWGEVSAETADAVARTRARGGRVVAVGTTSLRVLEASAQGTGTVRAWSGETDIFITPGYRFRAVDVLMTNFHLPRSTLFMLVAAFSGLERMRAAYGHAIERGYRFYSYGDASLLLRAPEAS